MSGGFGAVDFSTWATDVVVAVELLSFSASSITGGIHLAWVTQSETENMGFHIYRCVTADGEYKQITDELIPGAGNSNELRNYHYDDFSVSPDTIYYYKLADIDFEGQIRFHGAISASVTSLPTEYNLEQNYPNPFNPKTNIRFTIPKKEQVKIRIYNTTGQLIHEITNRAYNSGTHLVEWNGKNEQGNDVASGIYVYTLETSNRKISSPCHTSA